MLLGMDTARTGLGLDLHRDRAVSPKSYPLRGSRWADKLASVPQPSSWAWRSPGPSGKLHAGTMEPKSRPGPTQPLTGQEAPVDLSGLILKIGTTAAGLCVFRFVIRI